MIFIQFVGYVTDKVIFKCVMTQNHIYIVIYFNCFGITAWYLFQIPGNGIL